ncbi:hypothetical protein [Acanthopleuribacter pedis]|uniref:Ribonuclease H n=1 Tax=Acanthopleuribacter pedis TaxID=442870 RepID=A0A8J7QES1_9BACT|nr:hypothetical protein [Acanthopleuribacter pedis]MBO1317558.1 hypothetical protein [Acanthopleuribacter pedis]
MAKKKNNVYLVETAPGQMKKFTNWPDCQAFVKGKPYRFAGGVDEAEARAKISGGAPAKQAKSSKGGWSGGGKATSDKPKNNYYLVEIEPDQYKTFTRWSDCQSFLKGKKLPYAGGVTEEEAKAKIERTRDMQLKYRDREPQGGGKKGAAVGSRPSEGICSDAGTHGNPGPCEYQVCDLKGKRLAYKHLGVHTNNYAELAGIEAMIEVAVTRGETILWTDSQIAMGWIKSGRLGPTVKEPEAIMVFVRSIQALLKKHPNLELKKWHTKQWGEIPADFGRKG